MKLSNFIAFGVTAAVIAAVSSCGARQKLQQIEKQAVPQPQLELSNKVNNLPNLEVTTTKRDTIKVVDLEGKEVMLMKTIRDESTGEDVAAGELDAAYVSARFRNIAERKGKVDIAFQIKVPEQMQDSKWQLRFYPDMYVLGDSIRLEPVIITGKAYRRAQERGYEQYNKFLSRIISDSTKFVDIRQLEIFLERNIPQIFAFKSDTSYVSDEQFLSFYGVSEQQAVEHYTNENAKNMNERRKAKMDKMYAKYVRCPIITEGIRLDTVIMDPNGDFIYNYIQTVNTRPKMRKVEIVLSGEIFEQEKSIYKIPACDPLVFYISSLSSFVVEQERYKTKVIERQVAANTESHLDFELGKSAIVPSLGENEAEISAIKTTILSLLENKVYDLDSITVAATASPEGTLSANSALAKSRSESVLQYFRKYINFATDSLRREQGFSVNVDKSVKVKKESLGDIQFRTRTIPENWDDLIKMVSRDEKLTDEQKIDFQKYLDIKDLDARETAMRSADFYTHLKDEIYPRLRTVKFRFALHRRGMVKDTVHTTEIDSVYMEGLQHLKDMDYEEALACLAPYGDFNTAVAYTALYRDRSAMMILSPMERTPEVRYLLAILYSRLGDDKSAVDNYLRACEGNSAYVHRGNLDPEISHLIKAYNLNTLIMTPSVELGY